MKTQTSIRETPDSRNPSAGAGRGVLVIGAGVSGLTSALCLRRRGYGVTVVADRFAPRVTSVVAGALWEWPPAVCGHHRDLVSLRRSKVWCRTSFDIFGELAQAPGDRHFRPTGDVLLQAADRRGPAASREDGRAAANSSVGSGTIPP